MEDAKDIVRQILLIHDTNKMMGKTDNLDDFAKLVYNYKHGIKNTHLPKYKQPDDRSDNPHHHNNRLD
jgi:hypothetical protein